MSHFLVIHSRTDQRATRVERIDDARKAQERLFELEDEFRDDPERDVVLLIADREEDLLRTHGHYFKDTQELMALIGQETRGEWKPRTSPIMVFDFTKKLVIPVGGQPADRDLADRIREQGALLSSSGAAPQVQA
jgi:hypothetical protein